MAGCSCVVGLQWGDEAKGKIVDLLAAEHDIVVRYNGGANAGHTVVVNGKSFKLSLLPSGIIRPDKMAVIGNGVVVYPPSFLDEVQRNDRAACILALAGFYRVHNQHAHVGDVALDRRANFHRVCHVSLRIRRW